PATGLAFLALGGEQGAGDGPAGRVEDGRRLLAGADQCRDEGDADQAGEEDGEALFESAHDLIAPDGAVGLVTVDSGVVGLAPKALERKPKTGLPQKIIEDTAVTRA